MDPKARVLCMSRCCFFLSLSYSHTHILALFAWPSSRWQILAYIVATLTDSVIQLILQVMKHISREEIKYENIFSILRDLVLLFVMVVSQIL